MKKPVKVILIVSGIILALVLGFFAVIGIIMGRETSQLVPSVTGEAVPGILAVRDSTVNVWLVSSGDGWLAFDAGNSVKGVTPGLEELGVDPLAVTAVFLTHTDADHVGAVSLFKNAVIYIGAEEEQMINGTTARFPGTKNKLKADYLTVEDSESVVAGNSTVTALWTPGHTPGHTCWLVDGRFLFTGDTLGLEDGKVTLFNDFFNMDSEREAVSLKVLARSADPEFIFTGHHGWTRVGEDTFSAFR